MSQFGFDLDPHINLDLDPSHVASSVVQGIAGSALGQFIYGPTGAAIAVSTVIASYLTRQPDLINQAEKVANTFGISQFNTVANFWTDLSHGTIDPAHLARSLEQDYENDVKALGAAEAILSGDYRKTWNLLTDNGALWESLKKLNLGLNIPAPAPDHDFDIVALGKKVASNTIDKRDAATMAAEHGYYAQAVAWQDAWRKTLVASPLGAAIAAGVAKASKKPSALLRVAVELEAAAGDRLTINNWKTHNWGSPAGFLPLAADLRKQAADLLRPSVKKKVAAILRPAVIAPKPGAKKRVRFGATVFGALLGAPLGGPIGSLIGVAIGGAVDVISRMRGR